MFAANLIPIAAGGGGGLLLLIIIIVLVIVILGGKKKNTSKDDGRNVVAFENPMYDDPAKNGAAPKAVQDTGMYDEPTFDPKANPMYSSNDDEINENKGDGYLDVQPDQDDDDEEDEDESEDE